MAKYDIMFDIDLKIRDEIDTEDELIDEDKLEMAKQNPEKFAKKRVEEIVAILEKNSNSKLEYIAEDFDFELTEKDK